MRTNMDALEDRDRDGLRSHKRAQVQGKGGGVEAGLGEVVGGEACEGHPLRDQIRPDDLHQGPGTAGGYFLMGPSGLEWTEVVNAHTLFS
jgi:hypothetical protein